MAADLTVGLFSAALLLAGVSSLRPTPRLPVASFASGSLIKPLPHPKLVPFLPLPNLARGAHAVP